MLRNNFEGNKLFVTDEIGKSESRVLISHDNAKFCV